jgi:hypothetical protein
MPYSDMTAKRLERPRDPMQLGKLIVDIVKGQVSDQIGDKADSRAVALGARCGAARRDRPSPERSKRPTTAGIGAPAQARVQRRVPRRWPWMPAFEAVIQFPCIQLLCLFLVVTAKAGT